MAFQAMWGGTCSECDGPIKVGQSIQSAEGEFGDGEYAHVKCPELPAPGICGECHMQKPCDC